MEIRDFGVTLGGKEFDAAISLIVPMLHEQRATWPQPVVSAPGNVPDAREPVLAAEQGDSRLEARVAPFQMGVSRRDVRWI